MGLEGNTGLIKLNLSRCNLNEKWAQAIFDALVANKSSALTHLDLSYNDISQVPNSLSPSVVRLLLRRRFRKRCSEMTFIK